MGVEGVVGVVGVVVVVVVLWGGGGEGRMIICVTLDIAHIMLKIF